MSLSACFDLGANSSQDKETQTLMLISQALTHHIAVSTMFTQIQTHVRNTHTPPHTQTRTQQLLTMDLDPVISHPHSHSHSQIPLYAQPCTWLGVGGHLTDLLHCRNSTDSLIYIRFLTHTHRLIYMHQHNTHPHIHVSIYAHFR